MKTKTDNHAEEQAEEQAEAQYSSIVRMLAALTCDYDRLQELRDEREELAEAVKDAEAEYHDADDTNLAETTDALNEAREALNNWETDNAEELAELEDAAGECTDEDEARQIIQEDALEVQVRSDWESPGAPLEAVEFMILLCTGGPAVRIVGELNRGEPCRAWLEYQDWGTPWTQWFGAKSDTLCEYAANFFFGE
jgi:hypothetical protein